MTSTFTSPTLASAFHLQGWLTSGFVTHIYVSSLFGLDSGFDEWRELSVDWNFGEVKQLRADSLNSHVLPWLTHHRDKRFFLYVHYFDPHWNYAPPAPYDQKFVDPDYRGLANGTFHYMRSYMRKDRLLSPPDLQRVIDLYDGEILWTDHQIGRLFDHLKNLGIWDDSLLVVMSDHGEEFQEHLSFGHTRTLYEEVLRVPLIIKPPGGRPRGWRSVVTERVRNIDLATTLLHFAGLEIPSTFEGESLVGLLEKPGRDRPVFARTLRYGRGKIAFTKSRYKLIQTFAPRRELYELFDLEADPGEVTSLFKSDRELAIRMRRKATAVLGQMHRSRPATAGANASVEFTDNQLRHLRALGYVQ